MLTNQKWPAAALVLAGLFTAALTGCLPPGPRALLNGERLLKERKYEAAITQLTDATLQLPRNAQAWNHLGLANHQAGRANEALRAYRKALDVDLNLAPARFNLGCLLLELNQPAAAATEFASYTTLQPKMLEGWLRRGRAEMLAQQFEAAERSYRAAIALNPKQAEAWNTLGIVQLFRARSEPRRAAERYADAFQAFNQGVQQQANYAPALFNAALVSHFYLPRRPVDHRPFALEKYKAFLALNPTTDNVETVQQVVAQLEADLSPKPKPAPVAAATNPPPALVIAAAPKTEPPPQPKVTPPPTPAPEPIAARKPEPEVPKPATVAVVTKMTTPPAPSPITPPAPEPPAKPAPPEPKVFRPEPPAPTSKPAPPLVEDEIAPAWRGPRYVYLAPPAPTGGTRTEAQLDFQLGLSMQQIGKNSDAVAAYQRAIRADGAFFEAYHNLGIVAAQMGDLLKSTAAYETALALEPDSASARYNFALALQRGGYLRDAAAELVKLLGKHPDDAGAHFVLANLHSQNFNQPAKARPHYLKVLELRPQHPQATAIRFWLRENP